MARGLRKLAWFFKRRGYPLRCRTSIYNERGKAEGDCEHRAGSVMRIVCRGFEVSRPEEEEEIVGVHAVVTVSDP